jgi:hypothetical protein
LEKTKTKPTDKLGEEVMAKRSKNSREKGIMIMPSELPRFLLTGKVKTGRRGQTTQYKRRGTMKASPLGYLQFITGEKRRLK